MRPPTWGSFLKAVPDDQLDAEVEAMAARLASVPINQLAMQKMVINQAVEATGLAGTQRLGTLLDGNLSPHPGRPELQEARRNRGDGNRLFKNAMRAHSTGRRTGRSTARAENRFYGPWIRACWPTLVRRVWRMAKKVVRFVAFFEQIAKIKRLPKNHPLLTIRCSVVLVQNVSGKWPAATGRDLTMAFEP